MGPREPRAPRVSPAELTQVGTELHTGSGGSKEGKVENKVGTAAGVLGGGGQLGTVGSSF